MSITGLKIKVQSNPLLKKPYYALKNYHDKKIDENKFRYSGKFINRSAGTEKLCIILAGYKDFLYDAVFGRIEKFAAEDMDVCVVTSGLFSERIDAMCEKNGWSYLSTKENNVCLVQNVVIKKHPKARYIYKLDEDIFITKNFFEKMFDALVRSKEGDYHSGVIAPLIPVNGYGHVLILRKLGLSDKYTELFEKPQIAADPDRMIEKDPEAAKYFWGKGDYLPSIDSMNEKFSAETAINPCPIRFSIGAVLFERTVIEEMGFFPVERATTGMAQDEIALCSFCCLESRPIMVTENVVVGHFSFGPQTMEMKAYFTENQQKFRIED